MNPPGLDFARRVWEFAAMPKRLLFWMFLMLIILRGSVPVSADEPSATELLDKTLQKPGHWSQMCYIPPGVPFDVPFPLYGLMASRYSVLSDQNSRRLQARRGEIVPLVIAHLHALDLSKTQPPGAQVYSTRQGLQNPQGLSGVLLEIILDLHIGEALPELLRLEGDLNQQLEAAARDGGVTLPELNLDSRSRWEETGRGFEQTPEHVRLYAVRIYQREMLSVMAALLRHEKYPPLLASAIEDRYREFLTNEAKRNKDLKHIKTSEDILPEEAGWVSIDPVYHLPVKLGLRSIPYTPELRRQVCQLVKDYLELPPGQRGGDSPAVEKK